MIAIPTVTHVLAALDRTPEQLESTSPHQPRRAQKLLRRGLLGVLIGLVIAIASVVAVIQLHWLWILPMLAGQLIILAGVAGLVGWNRIRSHGDERSGQLLDDYLAALCSRFDQQNDAVTGSTSLQRSTQSEDPQRSLQAVRDSGLLQEAAGARADDLLTGSVLGNACEIRELEVHADTEYPGGGHALRPVFDGLLVKVAVDTPAAGTVQVMGRERGPALRGPDVGLAPVTLDDEAFTEIFEVRATAPEHAAVLTDTVRYRLLDLARDAETDDIAVHFEGGAVHAAIADDKDMFEIAPDHERANLLEQVASLHEDLALCVRVVDVLARQ